MQILIDSKNFLVHRYDKIIPAVERKNACRYLSQEKNYLVPYLTHNFRNIYDKKGNDSAY